MSIGHHIRVAMEQWAGQVARASKDNRNSVFPGTGLLIQALEAELVEFRDEVLEEAAERVAAYGHELIANAEKQHPPGKQRDNAVNHARHDAQHAFDFAKAIRGLKERMATT